jgi:predicted RNase H-like nuclease (RuvC/YqgF family)
MADPPQKLRKLEEPESDSREDRYRKELLSANSLLEQYRRLHVSLKNSLSETLSTEKELKKENEKLKRELEVSCQLQRDLHEVAHDEAEEVRRMIDKLEKDKEDLLNRCHYLRRHEKGREHFAPTPPVPVSNAELEAVAEENAAIAAGWLGLRRWG